MGARLYAVYKGDDFIMLGTAEEIASERKCSVAQVLRMSSAVYRAKHPDATHVLPIDGKPAPKKVRRTMSKARDMRVKRMVDLGLSFDTIAQELHISPLMARNAYNRAANGRWG